MTASPALQGVLSIDKPQGISSHDVVNQIRRISGVRRVGHAGTLDPLATGVLLACVGRATRLIEYLVGQPKWYDAVVRLGQSTNSYDAEGEIERERPFAHLTLSDIAGALTQFQGTIQQVPPMFSAIKKEGQPLYKLARQGVEVERQARQVHIYHLEVIAVDLPQLHLRIHCSTGTYIRSLAHDLGEALQCGGHIAELRRTAVGNFDISTAVSLSQLTPETLHLHLQPADQAVHHLPDIQLSEPEASRLLMGQPVTAVSHHPPATLVRAYNHDKIFLGILKRTTTGWRARKMFPPLKN